jgi:hypothetical protein
MSSTKKKIREGKVLNVLRQVFFNSESLVFVHFSIICQMPQLDQDGYNKEKKLRKTNRPSIFAGNY